jgi:hypothetical protein
MKIEELKPKISENDEKVIMDIWQDIKFKVESHLQKKTYRLEDLEDQLQDLFLDYLTLNINIDKLASRTYPCYIATVLRFLYLRQSSNYRDRPTNIASRNEIPTEYITDTRTVNQNLDHIFIEEIKLRLKENIKDRRIYDDCLIYLSAIDKGYVNSAALSPVKNKKYKIPTKRRLIIINEIKKIVGEYQ